MVVEFAFICETARYRGDNLAAAGIGRHFVSDISDSLTVCGQLEFTVRDVGHHILYISLVEPDGPTIESLSRTAVISEPDPTSTIGKWPFIAKFEGLDFKKSGPYAIRIEAEGMPTKSVPFEVF